MNEIVLNIPQYGLQEEKAKELTKLYDPMLNMLHEIETEYNNFVSQEMSETHAKEAKPLRLRIAKVRTTADKARKSAKEESLRIGKAIQGAYNTLEYAVKSKEEKLMSIEKHYENIEIERIAKLQEEREFYLAMFSDDTFPNLGEMEESVWKHFLAGYEKNFLDKEKAEKLAREEEAKRLKEKEDADRKMRAENEKLKIKLAQEEAEKRKTQAKIDAIEAEKRKENEKLRIKLAQEEAEKRKEIEKKEQLLRAPDKDKLMAFTDVLKNLQFPDVTSPEAKQIVMNTKGLITKTIDYLYQKSMKL